VPASSLYSSVQTRIAELEGQVNKLKAQNRELRAFLEYYQTQHPNTPPPQYSAAMEGILSDRDIRGGEMSSLNPNHNWVVGTHMGNLVSGSTAGRYRDHWPHEVHPRHQMPTTTIGTIIGSGLNPSPRSEDDHNFNTSTSESIQMMSGAPPHHATPQDQSQHDFITGGKQLMVITNPVNTDRHTMHSPAMSSDTVSNRAGYLSPPADLDEKVNTLKGIFQLPEPLVRHALKRYGYNVDQTALVLTDEDQLARLKLELEHLVEKKKDPKADQSETNLNDTPTEDDDDVDDQQSSHFDNIEIDENADDDLHPHSAGGHFHGDADDLQDEED